MSGGLGRPAAAQRARAGGASKRWGGALVLARRRPSQRGYFEKNRVFKAGASLGYISME